MKYEARPVNTSASGSIIPMAATFVRRAFSGIQPTGSLHLGNYFGAVKRWKQNVDSGAASGDQPHQQLYSIVDLHAITLPQDPSALHNNTMDMAASLLGCGLDPEKCVLFQQSRVAEHTELAWILGCHLTMPQLARLPQFREKSAKLKDVPLGLYTYPVLQSADILLYKGTHVPVGEDQQQNVQIAQKLSEAFNRIYGKDFFPRPEIVIVENDPTSRIRSLRNPTKKMSKSDPDWRSCIYVNDSPDVVAEKCKKAVTDLLDGVTYEPESRPAVSNLISIHRGFTGQTPEEICNELVGLQSGQYKVRLAEVINEHLKPIRDRISYYDSHREHLESILDRGAERAKFLAGETMESVRRLVGFTKC